MSDYEMQNYSNLWEQDYYQQQAAGIMSYQGFIEDSNEVWTKNTWIPDEKTLDSSVNNDARNYMYISSPEAVNPVSSGPEKEKTRRRNKGGPSQQQPTTFLNASIKDFRALVQQHTGCHNSTNSSPKGPITLCFASPSSISTHDHLNHQYYA